MNFKPKQKYKLYIINFIFISFQDFARIEPPDILQNTINSVCESEEIKNFKILKQLKNEQNSGLSNHKQLGQKLEETKLRVEE